MARLLWKNGLKKNGKERFGVVKNGKELK